MTRRLRLCHFNDVYNIESASNDPVGGAARFATLIRRSGANPLVLFSGDCFSPSLMSTVTQGKQMIRILNALNVQAACLGNHDLDFGLDHFTTLSQQCRFPWLASNVWDSANGELLGQLQGSFRFEWDGIQIGVMGLVEREWLVTLATLEPDDVIYQDFVEAGRKLAAQLQSDGAELVVALTHMRKPNDQQLLDSVPEIDLVLGGHDHDYHTEQHPTHRNLLIKSGTDFRDLTLIDIELNPNGHKEYKWEHQRVTHDVPEDPEIQQIVQRYVTSLGATLDEPIGYTSVELDGRFEAVRHQETNLGNFICDILREGARSEICFINSGTFRSDRIHPVGPLTKRDLLDILPMVDETVVLKLKGWQILEALENSVSQYPKREGRFLQVSGIHFRFDPHQPRHHRIQHDAVWVVDRGAPLDREQIYTVCTKAYLATGRDGFEVFKSGTLCQDSERSPSLPICIRYHFMKLDVLNAWKRAVVGGTGALVNRFVARMKASLDSEKETENPEISHSALFDSSLQLYVVAPRLEKRISLVSPL